MRFIIQSKRTKVHYFDLQLAQSTNDVFFFFDNKLLNNTGTIEIEKITFIMTSDSIYTDIL